MQVKGLHKPQLQTYKLYDKKKKKQTPRYANRARTKSLFESLVCVVSFVQLSVVFLPLLFFNKSSLTPSRTLMSLTHDEDFGPNMNSTSRTRGVPACKASVLVVL